MEGRVSDHLADGEKFLNQMSMPEDEENPGKKVVNAISLISDNTSTQTKKIIA